MISIIYLNYNRAEDIVYSLNRMFEQNDNDHEIIVVDNNSTDDSVERLEKEFGDQIVLYKSKENLGVAGGRNMAMSLAKGDLMLFIDDDAHFEDVNAVRKIKQLFTHNEQLGIVGFKVKDESGNIRDWVYNASTLKHNELAFFTNQFVGCCFALRSSLFNELGGYSQELFFWGEEIELCLKVFLYTKFKIMYYPDLTVVHRVSPKSRLYWSGKRTYYKVRNRLLINKAYLNDPKIVLYVLNMCFMFFYFLSALRNKAIKHYFQGIRDSRRMQLFQPNLTPNKGARGKYLKVFFNQLIGKIEQYK